MCDICGGAETGYDEGLSDFDMVECVNGHCFHTDCGDVSMHFSIEEMIDLIVEGHEKDIAINKRGLETYTKENNTDRIETYTKYVSDAEKRLAKFLKSDHNEGDLESDIEDMEIRYYYPASICPICNLSYITDTSAVKFMYKKYDVTQEEIKEEMKDKFDSIDELKDFIK